jgi:hypothetical protein
LVEESCGFAAFGFHGGGVAAESVAPNNRERERTPP